MKKFLDIIGQVNDLNAAAIQGAAERKPGTHWWYDRTPLEIRILVGMVLMISAWAACILILIGTWAGSAWIINKVMSL